MEQRMFGVGILVRLGGRLLAGTVADTGLLPASYYRHLVLSALEEEDFPQALEYLDWAHDPVLVQLVVLRLRLLRSGHQEQAQALRKNLEAAGGEPPDALLQELLAHEERADELLGRYEGQALTLLKQST
jgi:hypothetical protein